MAIWKQKSKNNGIRYKPMVRDINGKWMRSHTWDRKIDAEREERELLQAKDNGDYRKSLYQPLPFTKAAENWIEDLKCRNCSYGYRMRIEQYLKNHLTPFFGKIDIKEIKPSHMTALMKVLEDKGLKSNTINSIIKSLKAMLNFHIEEDNLISNPVKKKFKANKVGAVKEQIVWTSSEVEQFLSRADIKYRDKNRWVYIVYKIATNTGMRQGEIWALETSDFDFINCRIRINKSYDYRTKQIKTPKNGKSRYAPLSSSLASEIKKYIIDNEIFGPLFKTKRGEYYSYNTFKNCHYLKDIVETGIRRTKFHNTRRFFIREYLENGGTEAHLRKIVGHASRDMTDLYMSQQEDMTELAKLVNL